jgi:Emfourin
MKVRYRRTGGIANIKTQFEFDSDSLPPQKLETLKNLLKGKSSEKSTHSDDFIHELEVIDGASHRRLRFADSQCTPDDLALLDYLTQRYKDTKKTSRS